MTNNTLLPKNVLSTPSSIVIFVVVLCLVVAGVTEIVFAIREHYIEVQDGAARERENIERSATETSSATKVRVPWAVSYFGSQLHLTRTRATLGNCAATVAAGFAFDPVKGATLPSNAVTPLSTLQRHLRNGNL